MQWNCKLHDLEMLMFFKVSHTFIKLSEVNLHLMEGDGYQLLHHIMFRFTFSQMTLLAPLADLICRWGRSISVQAVDLFVTRLHVADGSIWKKFLPLATDLSQLKYLLEIFYHMANHRIAREMPAVLKLVKGFRQDEELIHGTVKLITKLWALIFHNQRLEHPHHKFESEAETLINSTYYLTVLLRISFVNCPTLFEMTFNFPRHAHHQGRPFMNAFLETLRLNVNSKVHGQGMFKVIRAMVPIFGDIIEYIRGHEVAVKYANNGSYIAIFRVLNVLLKNCETGNEIDFEAIIDSKIMINFIALFDQHQTEVIFPNPERKENVDCDICFFFRAVKRTVELLSKIVEPEAVEKRPILLETVLSILKCARFQTKLSKETLRFHNRKSVEHYLPYSKLGNLLNALEKVYKRHIDSEDFLDKYCNSDMNVVSIMIEMCKTIPDEVLTSVSKKLKKLMKHCKSPQRLVNELVPFLSVGSDGKTMNAQYLFNKYVKSQSSFRCYDEKGKPCTLWVSSCEDATFDVLDFVLANASLSQLKDIDAEYKFVKFALKVMEVCTDSSFIDRALTIILSILDKHNFELLTPTVVVNQMPHVWRKRNALKSLQESAGRITVKLAYMLMSDPNNTSLYNKLQKSTEFESTIIYFVNNHWKISPRKPATMAVIWDMVRSGKYKRLVKALSTVESPELQETVGYLESGDVETARIFKHLANYVVEYLSRDPPYNTKFLTDLTFSMVKIARSSSLDEELFVLEDLVSPAIWLLDDQDDVELVRNVKEFIEILH